MVSAVNTGSINMPKMLRHLSHRTNQVRDLVFVRDPVYRKDVMTTKDTNKDGTRSESLSGPAVNFGYETNSFATQNAGTNAAYHVNSPELLFPGLKAIQSPITSRSGILQRTGITITGECKFYIPSLSYISNLPEFSETTQFDELETYDKLMDVERKIISGDPSPYSDAPYHGLGGFNPTQSLGASSSNTATMTIYKNGTASGSSGYYQHGYEIDRLQARLKRGAAAGSSTAYISEIFIQTIRRF